MRLPLPTVLACIVLLTPLRGLAAGGVEEHVAEPVDAEMGAALALEPRPAHGARLAKQCAGCHGTSALAVADAWQDRGVGATLMGVLLEYARAAGMKRTFGTIHPDNARMVDLAHWLGMETRLDRADPRLLVASRSLD